MDNARSCEWCSLAIFPAHGEKRLRSTLDALPTVVFAIVCPRTRISSTSDLAPPTDVPISSNYWAPIFLLNLFIRRARRRLTSSVLWRLLCPVQRSSSLISHLVHILVAHRERSEQYFSRLLALEVYPFVMTSISSPILLYNYISIFLKMARQNLITFALVSLIYTRFLLLVSRHTCQLFITFPVYSLLKPKCFPEYTEKVGTLWRSYRHSYDIFIRHKTLGQRFAS